MPVVLEDQARRIFRLNEEGDDSRPLRRVAPGGFSEEVIEPDALGAENLTTIHQKPSLSATCFGARAQIDNSVVRFRARTAADQPFTANPLQFLRDIRRFNYHAGQ